MYILIDLLHNCFLIEVQYDLRLVEGASENEGRLEIQISGVWGTVCDDFWHFSDADVACRQLGFSRALISQSIPIRGDGLPTFLYNVTCSGNESFIWDCPNIGVKGECFKEEDVNLVCFPNGNSVHVEC